MRVLVLLATLLALPCLVFSAEEKKDEKKVEKKEEKALAKPAVRTVQIKSSIFQFDVRLTPGVPDPGQVEEVRIEMAEVPPVPDPIYGQSIPVKDAEIVAEVTDADGAGYTLAYRVHPLTDAGVYGFHFTSTRRDTYKVVLKGEQKSQKFSPSFRVPVGIWPIKDVDAKGNERVVPAESASSRMPALPGGIKAPATPAGPARASAKTSPMRKAMDEMGGLWVDLQVALFAGRKPDMPKVKAAAEALQKASLAAAGLKPADSDHEELGKEAAVALGKLAQAAGGGKRAPTVKAFEQVGGRHCNRCHFVKRWKVIANPEEFPGLLP